MLLFLLALVAAAPSQAQSASPASHGLVRLLDRSVWIDIGLGRNLKALTPGQIAELRKCKEPTMAFQRSNGSWVQSFYAGIETRTIYASAAMKSGPAGTTVLFYAAGHPEPAETLHIASGGDVLTEQTLGFRPHTFLKCNPPKPAPPKAPSRR